MRRLIVRDEDTAWAVLQAATEGRSLDEFIVDDGKPGAQPAEQNAFLLLFDGWPSIELDFKGRDWDSSVPTRVMTPLLDVQREVLRAFTEIRYGEANLRKLTDEDREQLELVVNVKKGSSVFNTALASQLTKIGEAAFTRMNGPEAVIAVIGIALLICATVAYKSYLASRVEAKKLEKDVRLSEQETQRMKVMANAMTARPMLAAAKEESEAVQNQLLKALRPGDSMTVGEVRVTSAEAEAIVRPERERSQDLYLHGVYRVVGNRTDKTDGYILLLQDCEHGTEFRAEAPMTLDADSIDALRAAEWNKVKVELKISASTLRGGISSAMISYARLVQVAPKAG